MARRCPSHRSTQKFAINPKRGVSKSLLLYPEQLLSFFLKILIKKKNGSFSSFYGNSAVVFLAFRYVEAYLPLIYCDFEMLQCASPFSQVVPPKCLPRHFFSLTLLSSAVHGAILRTNLDTWLSLATFELKEAGLSRNLYQMFFIAYC